jgi:hypothetical protein
MDHERVRDQPRVLCKVHHSPMAANVTGSRSSTKRRRAVVKKLQLGQNDAAGCSHGRGGRVL